MTKISCYKASVWRFGGKRRQCSQCLRTWSIRPARRGRHKKRQRPELSATVLIGGSSLRGLAKIRAVNRETMRRRFHQSLTVLKRRQSPVDPLLSPPLIAIADALYTYCENQKVAIPIIAIKSSTKPLAHIVLVECRTDVESTPMWADTFSHLPVSLQANIRVVVSDQHKGITGYVESRSWLLQLCHFHLKARFYPFLGTRYPRTISRLAERSRIWQIVNQIVVEPDLVVVGELASELRLLSQISGIPERLRWQAHGFSLNPWSYRTYLDYPKLGIPTTTNSVESTGQLVRSLLRQRRGFKTMTSLQSWLDQFKQDHPTVTCNSPFQQN